MQFKLDLLQPVGNVFVVHSFDEYTPLMGVVFGGIWRPFRGVEWLSFAAVNCRDMLSDLESVGANMSSSVIEMHTERPVD
jgi:hypothetical protein